MCPPCVHTTPPAKIMAAPSTQGILEVGGYAGHKAQVVEAAEETLHHGKLEKGVTGASGRIGRKLKP